MTVAKSGYPGSINNRLPIEETDRPIGSDKVEEAARFVQPVAEQRRIRLHAQN